MAINRVYGFVALTGEGDGALDKYPEADAPSLVNGDVAVGAVSGYMYIYYFDSASSEAESVPLVIAPRTGSGRWKLTACKSVSFNDLTLVAAATGFTIAGGTTSKTLTVDETRSITDLMLSDGSNLAIGSDADGDTYYRASGKLARLAKGTAGQVWTMNDEETAPEWMSDFLVKAWINLNGIGTISINDSYNVSSITDNGVGNYTVTWDIDFIDTNYVCVGSSRISNRGVSCDPVAAGSTTVYAFICSTGVAEDMDDISIIAIGGQ
jgi:hypothetical protein